MGTALAAALPGAIAGLEVSGPFGRGSDGDGADAVLLCVPDDQLAAAAAHVPAEVLVGHCSGARGLDALGPRRAAFGLHPLMTVTGPGAPFAGAGAAVAGSSDRALAFARTLADGLGLHAVEIADADRPAYHAAASLAANYLLTLEDAAERLLPADRALLVPLVRAAVEGWAAHGAAAALTGPVARGDEGTVARQRAAVAERTPGSLELWDVLTAATRDLAARREPAGAAR